MARVHALDANRPASSNSTAWHIPIQGDDEDALGRRHPGNHATVLANGRCYQRAEECDRTPTSSPTPSSAARPLLLTSGFLPAASISHLQACALKQHAARRSQRPRHGETIGQHRICWAAPPEFFAAVWFDANTVRRHATRYSCSAAKRPRATPPPHTLQPLQLGTATPRAQTIQLAAPVPPRTDSRGP